MWVRSLGQGDPLEWEMAGYSNILAWKNPMGRRDWLAVFHGVANSVGCELAIKQQQWPVRELSDKMTYVFKFMLLYCPPGFHNFNSRTIERLFFLYFQEYWMVFLFGMRHVNQSVYDFFLICKMGIIIAPVCVRSLMFLRVDFCQCPVCAQSCPALCDPVDCHSPGSPVHGIFQTGILEWVAISSSRKFLLGKGHLGVILVLEIANTFSNCLDPP